MFVNIISQKIRVGKILRNKKTIFNNIVWEKLEKYLITKGYEIQNFNLDNKITSKQIIDDLYNNKYDIIIEPLYQNIERYEKINFTYPFLLELSTLVNKEKKKKIYFKYFLEIILLPILILVFISLFVGIISIFMHKKNISSQIYYTILAFFGQSGGLLGYMDKKNPLSILFSLFIFIFIFFITILIMSFITAKMVIIYREFKIPNILSGKKILIPDELPYNIKKNLVEDKKAILIEKKVSNYSEIFNLMGKNDDIEYCYVFGTDLMNYKINKEGIFKIRGNKFKLLNSNSHYHNVCFGVNKNKKKLLKDINQGIFYIFYNEDKKNILCNNPNDLDNSNRLYYC